MTLRKAPTPSRFRPLHVFAELRAVLQKVGLAGEEKFGLGTYFVMASRFFANPLRLSIEEQTEGNTDFIVGRVVPLLSPGTLVALSRDGEQEWKRLKEKPEHKAVYLPDGDGQRYDGTTSRIRFEIESHRITRVASVKKERVVEINDFVEAPIACVSAAHGFSGEYEPRWLKMALDRPSQAIEKGASRLTDAETATWHRVQRELKMRAERGVVLPEWADLVVEQACGDYRSARYLPAFLEAWKTMCLLRSLERDGKELQEKPLIATFEDFAATGLFVRGVFREGNRFPSANKIFAIIKPAGAETSLIHPISGKGVRYRHKEAKQVQWSAVL